MTVLYDWRFLAQVGGETQVDGEDLAQSMAQKIKDHAEASLREYRDDLGLPIPSALTIRIKCQVLGDKDGYSPPFGDSVDLRLETYRNALVEPALSGFPPGEDWDAPDKYWKYTIDHELFHTIQWTTANLLVETGKGNHTLVESPAAAGPDLLAEEDDAHTTYLDWTNSFAQRPHPSIAQGAIFFPSDDAYAAASVLQYWGERFGPQDESDLEKRVARFLYALMGAPGISQEDDFVETIGYDWNASAYGHADLGAALRDYYLAHYALRAANVSANENVMYAILDAETGHGRPAGESAPNQAPYPDFAIPNAIPIPVQGDDLPFGTRLAGDVYELTFPPDTIQVAVHLRAARGAYSTALVPVMPNEQFVLDDDLLLSGPSSAGSVDRTVNVLGAERLALVAVRSDQLPFGGALELTATPIQGTPSATFLSPTSQVLKRAQQRPIVLNVQLALDGVPLTGDFARSQFQVKVNGLNATLTEAPYRPGGDYYHIEAWAPASLGAGTYDITLTFDGQEFQVPGNPDLSIDQDTPPAWWTVRAGLPGA